MNDFELQETFASATYHQRKAKKITQEALANALSISVRTYQKVEKGERAPSFAVAMHLIAMLDIDFESLLKVVKEHVPVQKS